MKTKLILMGSILALLSLTACKRERAEEINNPDYDAATESVRTQLVLNISKSPAATKQSAAETQATPGSTFLGIADGYLQPIYEENKNGIILEKEIPAADNLRLSDILGYDAIDGNATSNRVMQVQLPLRTNKLLFYGRGKQGAAPTAAQFTPITNVTPYDAYGHLENYTISKTLNSADFQLGRRLEENDNIQTFYKEERLLSAILTAIMNTRVSSLDISATGKPTQWQSSDVIPPYGYAVTKASFSDNHPYLTWADYDADAYSPYFRYVVGSNTLTDQSQLEIKLQRMYHQMTKIRASDGELRAGSGEAILRMIADLWSGINAVRWATPSEPSEAVAKYFAEQIFQHISQYFTAASDSGEEGGAMTGVHFKVLTGNNGILTSIQADESYSSIAITGENPTTYGIPDDYRLTTDDCSALGTAQVDNADLVLADFPFAFHLPRGATHISFNSDNHYFYYTKTFNVTGMNGLPTSGTNYNAESYYFPAELLYFGNGPIRTSAKKHLTSEYPDGTSNWIDDDNWSAGTTAEPDWTGNFVTAATKSVALKNNINYGVALLQTQVKYANGITTLQDNNKRVQELTYGEEGAALEVNKQITIKAGSFKLTGIIIGGQPVHVGWDYLPVGIPVKDDNGNVTGYSTTKLDGFIYDRAIHTESQAIPVSNSSIANYTTVFDNFRGTLNDSGIWVPATDQDVVNVALEFQNCTGEDFYGNFNLIPDGGYFYLIGTLNPNLVTHDANNAEVDNPNKPSYGDEKTRTTFLDRTDGYVVPPYAADGTSQKVPRVFIQDYVTKVTFVIGETSLQKAYLTVPDLRSSTMSLGLSVDMSWESGLEFNNVVLGY